MGVDIVYSSGKLEVRKQSVTATEKCDNKSKRAGFINIQSSHYVPIENSDVSRVRTGFEGVIAGRTSNPVFSFAAQMDGTVQTIDYEKGLMIVRYSNGMKVALPINSEYTNNSANGFYVDQQIVVNGFKAGDKFKAGDILTYNKEFFQADPYSKQVNWKIGILAKVALMDNGGTIEDASILTKPLCDKMVFHPVHVKEVVLTTKSNIYQYAHVGQEVASTDPLMIFEESPIELDEGMDRDLAEQLSNLNKFSPKAGHTGTIVKIEALYKSAPSNMSKTVKSLVDDAVALKNARSDLASECANAAGFNRSGPLKSTTRVGIVDLEEDTLILKFYIRQNKGMNPGDKLFFDSSLKSVCSTVYPDSIKTDDGGTVDACTSCRGILARIITSPFLTGIGNSVLEKLEQNMLAVWEGKEPATPVKN